MRLNSSTKKRRESKTRCCDTSALKRVIGNLSGFSQRSPSEPSTAGVKLAECAGQGAANISGRTMLLTSARASSETAPGGDSGTRAPAVPAAAGSASCRAAAS